MTRLWLSVTLVGAAAACALVWLAAPMLAIDGAMPLAPPEPRLAIIAAIILLLGASLAVLVMRRRRAAAALERGMSDAASGGDDAAALSAKMRAAITALKKKSRLRSGFLYELPWYLIIGPPGAGKTTALLNSGLHFPLADSQDATIRGVGGTRDCDWWFTDEAILIDTAGRYTTQDSDAKADQASWLAFLGLLRKHRPRQPINGVLVAISIEEIIAGPAASIAAHADAVRRRLAEVHATLAITVPVYVLFTKSDLVAGFMQYFADLDEEQRDAVWGFTFKAGKTTEALRRAPLEIDLLVEGLAQGLTDRLQREPDIAARASLIGFPAQVAAFRRSVCDFLAAIFDKTVADQKAVLRGVYFTSGTQEGTPIDQILGSLRRSFGVESTPARAFSGIGKTFFLKDMFQKVVFAEAGLVASRSGAARAGSALRLAGYAGIAAMALGAAVLLATGYVKNRNLVAASQASATAYAKAAKPLMAPAEISDSDLRPVYTLLESLAAMPAGYARRNLTTPMSERFGLSQRDRLASASQSAYRTALERLMRPRLLLRLEQQIRDHMDDPPYLIATLKVYLMLGGTASKVDNGQILDWFTQDWDRSMYPGSTYAKGRAALRDHLEAMLRLDDGQHGRVALDGTLIADAQLALARLNPARLAYATLQANARGMGLADWVASQHGGPDAQAIFSASDAPLDSLRVPGFYTYQGFYKALIDRIPTITKTIEQDRWVLGAAGTQPAVKQQFANLVPEILAIYRADFVASWEAALAGLRLKPLLADKPDYKLFAIAAGDASPIKALFGSISDETWLTRDGAKPADAAKTGREAPDLQAGEKADAAIAAIKLALQSQLRPGDPRFDLPGADIEKSFARLHQFFEGPAGSRPIDSLMVNLNALRESLATAANSSKTYQSVAETQDQLAKLRANISRVPPVLADMIQTIADDVSANVADTTVEQLSGQLGTEVSVPCNQIVKNRYPFTAQSRDEVSLEDFARLFGPDGILDKFYSGNLAKLVDATKAVWSWRPLIASSRQLSGETLRQFQQASQIKDIFFANGAALGLSLQVRLLSSTGGSGGAVLSFNATPMTFSSPDEPLAIIDWPGSPPFSSAVKILPDLPDRDNKPVERSGAWSLFRLLDAGRLTQRGSSVDASFIQSSREVSLQFISQDAQNPLTLPALRQFRCPAGL